MLEIGVEFDLVDRRPDLAGLKYSIKMRLQEITHTNSLGFARRKSRFHVFPLRLDEFGVDFRRVGRGLGVGEEGRVDEVEVDVVGVEFGEGGVERGGDVGDVADYFAGEVEGGAGDAAGFDGGGHLGLGVVDFGAVDVRVL